METSSVYKEIIISEQLNNLFKDLEKRNIDHGYAGYIVFCLIGSWIYQSLGADKFESIVDDIREKGPLFEKIFEEDDKH